MLSVAALLIVVIHLLIIELIRLWNFFNGWSKLVRLLKEIFVSCELAPSDLQLLTEYFLGKFSSNVCSAEKYTKCSSNTLVLRLVYFSAEQTLV